jgi:predicted lipid-binding transport protein (Tim44 family)
MKLWTCLLVAMLAFSSVAEAKRLGGGGSFGRQSSNVTQRQGGQPPAQQTAPTNAQQQQAATGAPAAAAAQRRPFGGMLGGLAAGLGLAWLAHALGFGEGFAQVLLLALLAVVVMAVIGAVMRSRRPAPAARTGGYAWQAPGAGPDTVTPAPQYNPDKIGNDASARPWERSSMAFDAAKYSQDGQMGARIGAALSGPQSWGIPPGFDTEGFIAAAKRHFVTLQDAWDHADVATLRSMMTDDMLAEIQSQIAAREAQGAGQPNRTDVVMLEARLLGIEDSGGDYLASVEFSGMMREDPSAGPSPFREVWNMTKPRNGAGGWLVAGVQALQ